MPDCCSVVLLDRYVIVGCHYDAWFNGGVNPNTGTAVMIEVAKALGEMVNKGMEKCS